MDARQTGQGLQTAVFRDDHATEETSTGLARRGPDQPRRRLRHHRVRRPSDPRVHVRFGPALATLTDAQVLKRFNLMIEAQAELAAGVDRTLTEIPPGRPQIEYYDRGDQWVPRAEVLRCHIVGDAQRGTLICIDDVELDMVGLGPQVRRGTKSREPRRTGRAPATPRPPQR